MHNAPQVTCPVGRSHWWLALTLIWWSVGTAVLSAWLTWSPAVRPYWLPLTLLCVTTGWLAWRAWHDLAEGTLAWRGDAWTWQSVTDAQPVLLRSLALRWDGQTVMLVQLQPQGHRAFWVCLTRRAAPHCWHDLRCAVYSRAMTKHAERSANASTSPSSGNVTPS